MQFVKFGLVGVLNTLISEGLYVIIVFFGGHYLVASLVGFVISVLNAYYWNSKYVFKEKPEEKRVWWKALLKTYAAYIGGYLLNVVLLILWIDIVKISQFLGGMAEICRSMGIYQLDAATLGEILAAGINLIVTVPINYLMNKCWVYRKNTAR